MEMVRIDASATSGGADEVVSGSRVHLPCPAMGFQLVPLCKGHVPLICWVPLDTFPTRVAGDMTTRGPEGQSEREGKDGPMAATRRGRAPQTPPTT